MGAQYSLEEIRDYWRGQAIRHGQAHSASWADEWAIDLEVREMLAWLDDGQRVLDVGCANGYSTVRYASQRDIWIRGLDVVPEMIEEALNRLEDMRAMLRGTAEFAVGDITSLSEDDDAYDVVIVTRVVINLAQWENQRRGLAECVRVLKPGGRLLLSEATIQGWDKLNAFRAEWGLDPIPMPPYNQYLDVDAVVEALDPCVDVIEIADFASSYYVGTRVLKPLLIDALGAQVDVGDASMHWNRWFSQMPAAGDYGTQKLFVFRKRP